MNSETLKSRMGILTGVADDRRTSSFLYMHLSCVIQGACVVITWLCWDVGQVMHGDGDIILSLFPMLLGFMTAVGFLVAILLHSEKTDRDKPHAALVIWLIIVFAMNFLCLIGTLVRTGVKFEAPEVTATVFYVIYLITFTLTMMDVVRQFCCDRNSTRDDVGYKAR